jgi:hypothetical protein
LADEFFFGTGTLVSEGVNMMLFKEAGAMVSEGVDTVVVEGAATPVSVEEQQSLPDCLHIDVQKRKFKIQTNNLHALS